MSLALLFAAALALAQEGEVTAHVDQAQAAAQRLQGPLDGRWRLVARNPRGPRLDLLLVDPPDGAALEGAWTGPGSGSPRPITRLTRRVVRLDLAMDAGDGSSIVVRLVRRRDAWRGTLHQAGRVWAVDLVRAPAAR